MAEVCERKDAAAAQAGAILNEEYEATYQRHLEKVEHTKSEYLRLMSEMVDQLRTSHFDPFAKVLLECENRVLLGQDEVMRLFKANLLESLREAFLLSWEECDITNNLVTLEMLKERSKDLEGATGNFKELTPEEVVLQCRLHYKKATKRYLEKQVAMQSAKLEELKMNVCKQRSRVVEMANQRVYLKEAMEKEIKYMEQKKQTLAQLQEDLLG